MRQGAKTTKPLLIRVFFLSIIFGCVIIYKNNYYDKQKKNKIFGLLGFADFFIFGCFFVRRVFIPIQLVWQRGNILPVFIAKVFAI